MKLYQKQIKYRHDPCSGASVVDVTDWIDEDDAPNINDIINQYSHISGYIFAIDRFVPVSDRFVKKRPVLVDGRLKCPNCHKNERCLHHYCDVCGQMIDWG